LTSMCTVMAAKSNAGRCEPRCELNLKDGGDTAHGKLMSVNGSARGLRLQV
jgi:hypothetical protein